MTTDRFGSNIPAGGLNFSPLTVTSHSNRVSILTVRGYASDPVKSIAETGNSAPLVRILEDIRKTGHGVRSIQSAGGPTTAGSSVSLIVEVDCMHPFISGLSMIAPSPDWFAQISNVNMYSRRRQTFRRSRYGRLSAYDAGTDDGAGFTPPGDPSLDIPTQPRKNIAPLVEDPTDVFYGRPVGIYRIKLVEMMQWRLASPAEQCAHYENTFFIPSFWADLTLTIGDHPALCRFLLTRVLISGRLEEVIAINC